MTTTDSTEALDVIVVGGGQAGLAIAYYLERQGARFLVLDAGSEVGESWRSRWDSLRLFTSAQYDALPGMPFPARPDEYPTKDMVADYVRDYAVRFALPVRLGCPVDRVEQVAGGFVVHTGHGLVRARQVVIATGPFQAPVIPSLAADLSGEVVRLHSAAYRRPGDLPAGPVVVVGAGNSGRQIAEELAATRDVTLAVGTAPPQLPQRFLGRDLFWWLTRTGLMTKTLESRLARRMRDRGDLVIGTPLSRLRRAGVKVRPRVVSITADEVRFQDESTVRAATVVWATGFRADYSWVDVPEAFDAEGRPRHERGISPARGLAFVGLPWQHTRGSALLGFVRHDAAWVAAQLDAQRPAADAGAEGSMAGGRAMSKKKNVRYDVGQAIQFQVYGESLREGVVTQLPPEGSPSYCVRDYGEKIVVHEADILGAIGRRRSPREATEQAPRPAT